MIKVTNLSVGIRNKKETILILDNISIDIPEGKFSMLTGRSGIGKTIFARTVSGLLPENFIIDTGTFYVKNKVVKYNKIKKLTGKGVFYCPQNAKASLNPVLKIKTQINDIKGITKDKVFNLMNNMAFEEPERILRSYPFELSEGECRRIILIMGLLLKPELLILDEPTSSLDIKTQNKLFNVIVELNKKHNIAILLITHNLSHINIKDTSGNPVKIYQSSIN